MKAVPQERVFFPPLSINSDVTPSTITTPLSRTAVKIRELWPADTRSEENQQNWWNRWLFAISKCILSSIPSSETLIRIQMHKKKKKKNAPGCTKSRDRQVKSCASTDIIVQCIPKRWALTAMLSLAANLNPHSNYSLPCLKRMKTQVPETKWKVIHQLLDEWWKIGCFCLC